MEVIVQITASLFNVKLCPSACLFTVVIDGTLHILTHTYFGAFFASLNCTLR